MKDLKKEDNLKYRSARFQEILTTAASHHIGKSKPGKKHKCWMNPTIRTAIKKRNRLRRDLSTEEKRKEWIEMCKEVSDMTQEARTEAWKDLLQDTINETDDYGAL